MPIVLIFMNLMGWNLDIRAIDVAEHTDYINF